VLETYKAVTVINTDYNDFVCILRRVSSMSLLSWVDLNASQAHFQTSRQCQSLALVEGLPLPFFALFAPELLWAASHKALKIVAEKNMYV
jgi:hypothetical protein